MVIVRNSSERSRACISRDDKNYTVSRHTRGGERGRKVGKKQESSLSFFLSFFFPFFPSENQTTKATNIATQPSHRQ